MEQQILKKLEEQEKKLEEIGRSVEKIRKYLLWAFILMIAAAVIPLIGILFAIPAIMSLYSGAMMGL